MTTTETAIDNRPDATQGFTSTIHPDDFADYGTRGKYARRTDKTGWTQGTLAIVAAVLNGWPCLIEIDKSTRHTVVGIIESVGADYRQPAGWNCVVRYTYPGGSHRTAHAGINVGTITPLPTTDGNGRVPGRFDVTDAMRDARRAALDAFGEYVKAETGGYQWYGKRDAHAGANGSWHVYFESQENDRYDVTTPRKLSDGTTRKEYAYGPLEATCTVSADGKVSNVYTREHTPGSVVRNAD